MGTDYSVPIRNIMITGDPWAWTERSAPIFNTVFDKLLGVSLFVGLWN